MALYNAKFKLNTSGGGQVLLQIDTTDVDLWVKNMYKDEGVLVQDGTNYSWVPTRSMALVTFEVV